jgi:type 1 fimbriae regulatory protein FimB/type 1 fimbriae regulatory protein FimE
VGATANAIAPRSYSLIATDFVLLNSARCVGRKSICATDACTSIEPRADKKAYPLHGPELRALRPLQGNSPYVVTEAGTPVTTAWFLRMVQRTARAAKLPFPVHPHMLRHSTGYKLANDGHDTRSLAHYLGHRNLQSTARYTALAPDRFAKFWQD